MEHRHFRLLRGKHLAIFLKKLWITALIQIPFEPILCQPEINTARNRGIANQGVTMDNLSGFGYNSAALAGTEERSIMLSTENRFIGTGIKGVSVLGAIPIGQKAAFGLHMEQYGIREFSQQYYHLGYGRKLSNRFSIGSGFAVRHNFIPGYENNTYYNLDLGWRYVIKENLIIAHSAFIPFQSSGQTSNYNTIHLIGIQYKLSLWINLFAQLEKENQLNWVSKYGLEYQMNPQFVIRLGVKSDASEFHSGIGIKVNERLQIDISASVHTALGLTPALSLGYNFVQRVKPADH